MSIFGKNSKYNNIKVSSIPIYESFDIESSAYNIIRDINYDSFIISVEHSKGVYAGMKYNNINILIEAADTFLGKVKEFFKTLIRRIVDFFKNSMKFIVSFFQDFGKFLTKNRDYLLSLNPSFSFQGFNYKFPEIPKTDFVNDMVDEFNYEMNRIEDLSTSDVTKMSNKFADPAYKAKLRSKVLGGSGEIHPDEFAKESEMAFSQAEEPITINVDNAYINNIIKEYPTIRKLLDDTTKEKNNIIGTITSLSNFFERKAITVYDNDIKYTKTYKLDISDNKLKKTDDVVTQFNYDKAQILNKFFNLKFKESEFICNCITRVYVDKVNAIKNALKQNRSVIRKCITSSDKNRGKLPEEGDI